jgi:predicted TIM-barrel fold metal-dependent hydrolase
MAKPDLGVLEGLYLIDADSHYSEPHDLWTSRAPASLRDIVPQVRPNAEGQPRWWLGDHDLFSAGGGSFVDKAGAKVPLFDKDISQGMSWAEIHQASYDAKARLALMDEIGIWAQIVYPNTMGFAMYAIIREVETKVGAAIVSIYNDAIAQWQEEGNNRLLPMAVLPFWDIPASIKEAQRAASMGLRGITMAGNPHLGGLPDLGQPEWEPLYEVLQDLDLSINIHVGSTASVGADHYQTAWPSLEKRAVKPVNSVQMELNNSKFISNLCVSDIILKYPDLKWVSVESGIGWIPYVLERVDYEYREAFPDYPPVTRPNALEMFRRGIYGTFWFEHAGPNLLLDYLGADNIMWETDFPHPTCLYPSPVERSAKALAGVDPANVRKIVQDNAAKLYKIELPSEAKGS